MVIGPGGHLDGNQVSSLMDMNEKNKMRVLSCVWTGRPSCEPLLNVRIV